ncbi:MAG: spore germination protein [Clostridia bacterium]|nr:spore germination protein [Clostridia bacterium]
MQNTPSRYPALTDSYSDNVALLDRILRVEESFDLIKKPLKVGKDEMTLYYIDGFIKDTVMMKLMMSFLALDGMDLPMEGGTGSIGSVTEETHTASALRFCARALPYVETDVTDSTDTAVGMVLSGAAVMVGSPFGRAVVVIDARTYPARDTAEPEGDKVMRGARDGFVETLIFNTALIRRRVRDPALTVSYLSAGSSSRTDIAICYMEGKADSDLVDKVKNKLAAVKTDALAMGHESLAEVLIKRRWYNPFPKIRYTERPDTAAAQLMEGSVLVICDTSPQVMILPTSIFDFMQETNDFYFPPLTGTYIRIVRHAVFWLTLFLTPTWYLLIMHPEFLPGWLSFILPTETGRIPIIAQLLLVEFMIDGLRMASLNTPSMLSNSLSVVGGLILGDFAVQIGWLIPEVILYMAFVAIANFTQRSYELGYAFKFMRMGLLILTAIGGYWGFGAGLVGIVALLLTNVTVTGKRHYLYPLIPFDGKALKSLFFRVRKDKGGRDACGDGDS